MLVVVMLGGAVIVVAGALLIVSDRQLLDHRAERCWAIACIAAVLCSVSYGLADVSGEQTWIVATGNAAMVLAYGAVWGGLRSLDGASPAFVVVAVAVGFVTVASVLPSELDPRWVGSPEKFGAIACILGAALGECRRSSFRRFRSARIVGVLVVVQLVYTIGRLALLVAWGPEDARFVAVFGIVTATVINGVSVVIAAIALMLVRAEASRVQLARSGAPMVLSRRSIGRALRSAPADALHVRIAIDDYPMLRSALGSSGAYEMSLALLGVVARSAPDGVVVGRSGPGSVVAIVSQGQREWLDSIDAAFRRETQTLADVGAYGPVTIVIEQRSAEVALC